MKKLLTIGAMLAAFAGGAQAADLGVQRVAVPSAIIAPVGNWTGFYVGGTIGYGFGSSYLFQGGGRSAGYSTRGLVGGVTVGYNHQINNIVLGAELDASISGIKSDLHNSDTAYGGWGCAGPFCRTSMTWFGTARGRLGYAAGSFMPYVTGGLAVAGLRGEIIGFPAFVGTTTKLGWTVGAGVEAQIAANWTVKAEYLYLNFGRAVINAANQNYGVKQDAHIVRLGVNYLFSTGPSAVVARY
jgi:outer membrane immunogenic protein